MIAGMLSFCFLFSVSNYVYLFFWAGYQNYVLLIVREKHQSHVHIIVD